MVKGDADKWSTPTPTDYMVQAMEWTDMIGRWSDDKLYDFLNTVYGGGPHTKGYLDEKINTIHKHGVWWWSGTLDSSNLRRLYRLMATQTPTEWYLSYNEPKGETK